MLVSPEMKNDNIEARLLEYEKIREDARTRYSSFVKVFSPALSQYVHFTSNGFKHLIYSGSKKERDKKTQILRFDLLDRAREIVSMSTTFQEYEESIQYRRINRNGKYIHANVLVKSWGLVAIINKFRVKVVVLQVGNGKAEFYSVIPAWFTRQYRGIKLIETSTYPGLLNDKDSDGY